MHLVILVFLVGAELMVTGLVWLPHVRGVARSVSASALTAPRVNSDLLHGDVVFGFTTLKDVLEVLVIPIALFAVGAALPGLLDRRRKRSFISLIRREVEEMNPQPETPQPGIPWHAHLKKRFVHEQIFSKPSENRDFILSLSPDLAYNEVQLWVHFNKATCSTKEAELQEHGARFCDYFKSVCKILDGRDEGRLYKEVCTRWEKLIGATGQRDDPEEKNEVVAILFRAEAKPGKRQDLVRFLNWDREQSLKREPGTMCFEVFQDLHSESVFYVYEAYKNAEAFEEHQKNEPYERWCSAEMQREVVLSYSNLETAK